MEEELKSAFGCPLMELGSEQLLSEMENLYHAKEHKYEMLVCETAVDKIDYFEVVYHLRSFTHSRELIVKVSLSKEKEMPELPSVAHLWQAAELFEDEIYDLFGIRFTNHPNLRRIMLDDDFQGHPLRKDWKPTELN